MADISYKDLIAPSFYGLWNDVVQQKYPEIWLAGGRGCIDGNTLIDTPKGKVRVKDFNGGLVYSIGEHGQVIETIACKPIRYTREYLFRVNVGSKSILVTDEHKFLTKKGWKRIKDICEGDFIAFYTSSYCQKHQQPTPSSEVQNVSFDARPSKACRHHSASVSLCVKKDSLYHFLKHCVESPEVSHEDALRLMRILLSCIYRCWQDYHLCDEQPPKEGETYLTVFQQLDDALGHNHGSLHLDDQEHEQKYIHYGQRIFHHSKQDYRSPSLGKHSVSKGNGILQRLSELLLEIVPLVEQSQKNEDLACSIQLIVRLVLSSISHLDSLEDGLSESDACVRPKGYQEDSSLQMLYDMLRNTVHDESYSDSFQIKENVCLHDHHYTTWMPIRSIRFEKKDYYYDLFVPIYNNYIAEGFINHNSTKSSFVSTCIPLLMEMNPKLHCCCFRKYGTNLADSVYAQFEYTINEKLRPIADHWIFKKSPLKIILQRPNGQNQQILFRGLDDPQKVKSLKAPFGYFGLIWLEELAEFDGIEEVRNVLQSLRRGGHYFQTFASYNPPPVVSSWVVQEAATPQIIDGKLYRFVHHSDYRTVPKEWLGDDFFKSADLLKSTNELAYRHEYLGEVTGNGGAVFPNARPLQMSDEFIETFDNRRFGLDFGFSLDPAAFLGMHYNKNHRELYIFDEIYETNLLNMDLAARLETRKAEIGFNYIMCDSAEPKSIAELEMLGVNVLPARKGPDSVRFGIRWLQSLAHIYIDPVRCPNTWREFSQYEYEKNRAGLFISRYPDVNNHSIDACRYGTEEDAANSGIF